MSQKKGGKKDNFIMQAGILAIAGVISRLIGLLYRSPLTGIIGDEGNGYYSSAYNIYTIVLLISSYSIPSAVSKVISQKLALKEYRNAHRLFLCSLYYVIAVGGVASLILFFCGDLFLEPNAARVLQVFAPTIFVYGLLGVLRGYFQAHRSMIQTSFSQIIEQIVNAAVSIGAAYLLIMTSMGSMDVYTGENLDSAQLAWNTNHAIYGAMGSAMGTGAGVLIALLFMVWIYAINRNGIYRKIKRDRTVRVDSYSEIFKVVLLTVTPFILSTALYNLSTTINLKVYTKAMIDMRGVAEELVYRDYGIFAGKAVVISNIPIALASAMAAAILPGVATLFAQREFAATRRKVALAIKMTMLISIPSAVGLAVLAKPVTQHLFPQKNSLETAANLLCALAISVVFYALSTLSNSVLQGIGKINIPVIHSGIALVIQTIVLVPLVCLTNLSLYSLVIANIVYSFAVCVLNAASMRKYLAYRQEWKKTYILPSVAALIMGAAAYGTYHGLNYIIPSNLVCLMIAMVIAVAVYFVLLILFGVLNEEELLAIPKGQMLVRLMRRIKR